MPSIALCFFLRPCKALCFFSFLRPGKVFFLFFFYFGDPVKLFVPRVYLILIPIEVLV